MTQQTGTVDTAAKIKDLEEENELLLLQLHQVQEELEVYFLKYKDLEAGRGGSIQATAGANIVWVDDELPEALAEIERLKTLAQVQAEIKEIESRNALNVKLGNMLLESSSTVGGISKIPFALLGFWRNTTSKKIPAQLGGKEFTGVIKAYEERSFVGVKSILKEDGLSPIVKANAYTALARHLMRRDAKAAAEAASKAFEIDPKAYRLKWLSFKLHDAGDIAKADAMLDLLPLDTKFSDSEERQVRQLRYEAKNARQRQAKQKSGFFERRAEVMAQLSNVSSERDKQSQLAEVRRQEIEALSQAKAQVETDRAGLAGALEEAAQLAEARRQEIEALSQAKAQVEADKAGLAGALKEATQLAEARSQEIEGIKQLLESQDAGKNELATRQQLMHQEMIRAEAQIDLIKDILLREPEL